MAQRNDWFLMRVSEDERRLIQVLAQRKGIELSFSAETGQTGATVWCDLERLERVFVNLLSNAVKFTPPGGHVAVALRIMPGVAGNLDSVGLCNQGGRLRRGHNGSGQQY